MSENLVPQKDNTQIRVLLIGDDMRSFLTSARALGRLGVEVHAAPFDWHAPALASKYIGQVHYLPRVGSWTKSWLRSIQRLHEQHKYDLVIPCCERSLLPLYAQRHRLADMNIAHPGDLAMEKFFDKMETRHLAMHLNVPVAKGEAVDANSDAIAISERYGLPLMLKARRSYSTQNLEVRGDVVLIESVTTLKSALDAIEDSQAYFVEQIFPSAGPASGLGVSVAARNGEILSAFQHRRIKEKPGGGSSSVRISEPIDPQLMDAVTRLTSAVALNGVAMYEFRQSDESGDWILLEVNARPWGSMPLPLALGLNFPAMILDVNLLGDAVFDGDYREGIVGRNLMLSLIHFVEDKDRPNRYFPLFAIAETLKHFWRCARGVEVSDSFVWDDLRPAFLEYLSLSGRFLRRRKWFEQGMPERRALLPLTREDYNPISVEREQQLDSQFEQEPDNDRKVS